VPAADADLAAVWDTSIVSRLRPDDPSMDFVVDRLSAGAAVRVAAPALAEVAFGYQRVALRDPRAGALLGWFSRLLGSEPFSVVPMDDRAALVAGRLRGVHPHPPHPRTDGRSKTMRQAAWLMDIQIAATAFAAGLDVATRNNQDFLLLGDLLVDLFPQAPPLQVLPAPF
jgi:predicted nucleic acid-binding protein